MYLCLLRRGVSFRRNFQDGFVKICHLFANNWPGLLCCLSFTCCNWRKDNPCNLADTISSNDFRDDVLIIESTLSTWMSIQQQAFTRLSYSLCSWQIGARVMPSCHCAGQTICAGQVIRLVPCFALSVSEK